MEKILEVSIIVLNYNGLSHLDECFNSLEQISYPSNKLELIFVDNNSSDGSIFFMESNYPKVKILSLNTNLGWSGGNNEGAKIANGKYLVFLNNDTVASKEWLTNLVLEMDADESIGAASSKVLYYHNKNLVNSMGCFMTFFGLFGSFRKGMYEKMFFDNIDIFAPSGASMIVHSGFFRKIGMFDSSFFLYCDDADFGWRTWNYGKRCVSVPSSKVYHKEHGSPLLKPNYYYYMTRNKIWTIIKNSRLSELFLFFPLSIISSFFQGLIFFYKGKHEIAKATFKGIFDSFRFKDLFRVFSTRKGIPKNANANKYILGFGESMAITRNKIREHVGYNYD